MLTEGRDKYQRKAYAVQAVQLTPEVIESKLLFGNKAHFDLISSNETDFLIYIRTGLFTASINDWIVNDSKYICVYTEKEFEENFEPVTPADVSPKLIGSGHSDHADRSESLKEIFLNNFDCYADVDDDSVVMAMTMEKFVEICEERA